jgi:predicted ATPase
LHIAKSILIITSSFLLFKYHNLKNKDLTKMLNSIHIEQFRAFKKLIVNDLERINLFVGKNNSGKTTILEAVEILVSGNNPATLAKCAMRRGEMLFQEEQERTNRSIAISHLFYGHNCEIGASFNIEGKEEELPVSIKCEIDSADRKPNGESKDLFPDKYSVEPRAALVVSHSSQSEPTSFYLDGLGGISIDIIRRTKSQTDVNSRPTSFVKTDAESIDLRAFWDSIALTEEESKVIEILKILDPQIERIAFLSRPPFYSSSFGGIYVKMKDIDSRIPLGSLGDGIRHLLIVSLAISRAPHGFVMIDEIDTGLHHSIMRDMWRVLIKTAERLDVQLFATTHSSDCLRSLARLVNQEPDLCKGVRLHRVDIGREKTVVYSPEEILSAAQQDVEVRG